MGKRFLALLLAAAAVISLCSCQQSGEDRRTLTAYCLKDEKENYVKTFNTYNAYCTASGLGRDYQVEFVTFESISELNKKMTTEIMAGGGPDIFLTSQALPFEKMMESEMFADVDELFKEQGEGLKLSEYNEKVLNAGVYLGRRYIVPLLYTPNASFAYKESLESVGIKAERSCAVSYNDTGVMQKLIEKADSLALDYRGYTEDFVEKFICDYVDFEKKETDFESEEFKKNLDLIKQLYLKNNEETQSVLYQRIDTLENAAYAFVKQEFRRGDNAGRTVYDEEAAENTCLCRGIQRDKSKNLGTIEFGVAINKNTAHKKKAVEFIKYALSEDGQSHLTRPHNWVFSAMPVNKRVFEKRVRNAAEVEVNGEAAGLDSEIMKTCVEISKNVEECSLDRAYYSRNIAGGLVRNYLDGKLPKNKFIRQLKTATKFYLEE